MNQQVVIWCFSFNFILFTMLLTLRGSSIKNTYMEKHYRYATVSEALEQLAQKGFTTDFNLQENSISCENGKFGADEFEVKDVYRYEGDTDPADEATVYAIESASGIKGVLVTGYGASDEDISPLILQKLKG